VLSRKDWLYFWERVDDLDSNRKSEQRLTGISIFRDVASWRTALRHLRRESADQRSVENLVLPMLSRPGPSLSSSRSALSNSFAGLECLKYLMVLRMVLMVWSWSQYISIHRVSTLLFYHTKVKYSNEAMSFQVLLRWCAGSGRFRT